MKKYALGIDLGGTGTKFGLVNEDGQVLRSSSLPTQQYPNIDEYCDVLCAGISGCESGLDSMPFGMRSLYCGSAVAA